MKPALTRTQPDRPCAPCCVLPLPAAFSISFIRPLPSCTRKIRRPDCRGRAAWLAAFSVVSGCRPLGTRTCLARAPAACPRYARAVDSPFGAYLGSEEVESESQVRRILLRKGDIPNVALGMPTVTDSAGTAGCPFDPRLDTLRLTRRVFCASGARICDLLELLSFIVHRLSLAHCLCPGVAVPPPGPVLVFSPSGCCASDLSRPTPLACMLTAIIRLPTITADLAGRACRALLYGTGVDGL